MVLFRKIARGLGLVRPATAPPRPWRSARPLRPLGMGDLQAIRLEGPVNQVSTLAVEVALKTAEGRSIELFINSDGGDLPAALELHWTIRRHPWRVISYVEDEASSAALLIALAGDIRRARADSRMLVHRSSCAGIEGNASDLRALSWRLDAWDLRMAALIAGRTRRPLPQVEAWMRQEVEFSALEAKENGLVHEVEGI